MKSKFVFPVILLFLLCFNHAWAEFATLQDGNMHINLIFEPKANEPFDMVLLFYKDNVTSHSAAIQNAKITFNMVKMNMGNFIFEPEYVESENKYVVKKIILPRCMSGDKRWYVDIDFTIDNKAGHVKHAFNME